MRAEPAAGPASAVRRRALARLGALGSASWGLLAAALLWGLLSIAGRSERAPSRPLVTPDRLRRAGLLSLAALLLAAGELRAQQPPDSVEVAAPAPTLTLGGVANYDAGGRRDPFVPLFQEATGGVGGGPRFETLKLTGIFLGTGANSLVVLEDPSHRGYFVRLGQRIGNARLVEILSQAAVFEVSEYGASRRVVLRLERTEESP